jgi:osmotically-inducible protein OsmY
MDQLIEARVRAALAERLDANLWAVGIDVMVKNGKVTLSGAMSDERMIAEAVRRVHAVNGVQSVESRIQHLTFARGFG